MWSTTEEDMEVSHPTGADFEWTVMTMVVASEARGDPPWLTAAEVGRCCVSDESSDSGFSNADLACVLVSNLCFSHNTPYMWKLLEQAMASGLVYPLQALALLTPRL
jgi:hypothetical protein